MAVKTHQDLCCLSIAMKLSLGQISALPLAKSLKALVLTTRENLITEFEQAQKGPNSISFGFDLNYCCMGLTIGRDETHVTNRYFNKLFAEHIKSYKFSIEWSDHSGYIDLYTPSSIMFTTTTNDNYKISYSAQTVGENIDSNWNRIIKIWRITYTRNDEPTKELKFMFVYGYGCRSLVRDDKATAYNMPYIALDDNMNYVSHHFPAQMFNSDKHAQKTNAQLTDLIETHKASHLPFFVYFLESISDPIMRLIYMFTYMPSIRVLSGK
jgi:hypothetical protein